MLIHKLRLMADAGGMLTKDRLRVIRESADRLESIDERIAIMTETENPLDADAYQEDWR